MRTSKLRTIISFLLAVTLVFSWIPAEALEVGQSVSDSTESSCTGSTVTIPSVTADVVITAKPGSGRHGP